VMVGVMLSMTRGQWGVDISSDICCPQMLSELQDLKFKEVVPISSTSKIGRSSVFTMYAGFTYTNPDVTHNLAIDSRNLEKNVMALRVIAELDVEL
jgi:hypothetical protein